MRTTPQLGVSLTNVFLTTLVVSFMLQEPSIMLLENIYRTGHDDCHLQSSYLYSTGHLLVFGQKPKILDKEKKLNVRSLKQIL